MKDNKLFLNFLKASVCLWSAASLPYYGQTTFSSAMLLSILVLTLVLSYIEAAHARFVVEKKEKYVTNHKLGMIISVICSYRGCSMVKRRFIKGRLFVSGVLISLNFGLTWLGIIYYHLAVVIAQDKKSRRNQYFHIQVYCKGQC